MMNITRPRRPSERHPRLPPGLGPLTRWFRMDSKRPLELEVGARRGVAQARRPRTGFLACPDLRPESITLQYDPVYFANKHAL